MASTKIAFIDGENKKRVEVEVVATGKCKYRPANEVFKVHPELAKKLVKQGKVKLKSAK